MIWEVARYLKNIPKSKIENVAVFLNVLMIGDHHFDDDEARNFLGDYDSDDDEMLAIKAASDFGTSSGKILLYV